DLRADARRKALAAGLPYYFTCNMAEVVLYAVATEPGRSDVEEASFQLAPITHSSQTTAYQEQIEENWIKFLDDLERRLISIAEARPRATSRDVLLLRDAIYRVAEEAISRVVARVESDASLAERLRARSS